MWLFLASIAGAQGIVAPGEVWDNFGIDPASLAYEQALHAARTNTRVFGPIGYLEREMLPQLARLPADDGEIHLAMIYSNHQMYGVVRVPYVCDWNESYDGGCVFAADKGPVLQHRPVDSVAATFGIGARWRFLSAYYIANSTMTHIQEDGLTNLLMDEVFFMYSIVLTSALAPVLALAQSGSGEDFLPPTQFVVGVAAHSPAVDLHFAVLAPNDLYTNIDSRMVGLFAESLLEDTLVLDQAFARAPLLKTGLLEKAFVEEAGKSSAFIRKIQMVGSDAVEPTGPAPEATGTQFWTGHLEQAQIANFGTIGAAISWKPTPMVHEFHVGFDRMVDEVRVQAIVGTVRLPDLPQYGLSAATRPTFLLSGRLDAVEEGPSFHGSFGLNEPETLSYFPYARGAFRLQFGFSFGF